MKVSSSLVCLYLLIVQPYLNSAFAPCPQQSLLTRHVVDDPQHCQPATGILIPNRPLTTTCRLSLPRRDFLVGTTALTTASTNSRSTDTKIQPIADLPMIRLKLPRGGVGREYVAIKLKINGQGPFDFMVDTGLTTEFITPHLQQILGIRTSNDSKIRGFAAGGESMANPLVELTGAALCCGDIANGQDEYPLPPLHAIITDFPQEHIDPAHDPVEGMLGMELLSLFDVDFDFPKGRLRLWKPGTAAQANKNLVEIPAVVINETGLIGIRLATPNAKQPVLGFLDCGSTFSTVNWSAASYLGLPPKQDPVYKKSPTIMGLGVDGRPLQLPTTSQELTFVGDVVTDPASGRPSGFAMPPSNWEPWKPVLLAVGDLPAFSSILGDGTKPYTGPAVLIGLDVLAQRRVILETGEFGTRRRRILVSPS